MYGSEAKPKKKKEWKGDFKVETSVEQTWQTQSNQSGTFACLVFLTE